MILDYALEKFPLHVKLQDGTECVVRPLGKRDAARLHKFILAVPEEERLFIKQPVAERGLFHEWCRDVDFEHNLPLLMLDGEKVIGEACLHQRLGGWKRHIGMVTVLTHPDYPGVTWPKPWWPSWRTLPVHWVCGGWRRNSTANER